MAWRAGARALLLGPQPGLRGLCGAWGLQGPAVHAVHGAGHAVHAGACSGAQPWPTQPGAERPSGGARPADVGQPRWPLGDSGAGGLRGFASSAAVTSGDDKEAARLLQQANMAAVRALLAADPREVILYDDLVQLCRAGGAGLSDEAAGAAADALQAAGVVLRFKERVYLRPEAVLAAIETALPSTPADRASAEHALAEISTELTTLEQQKAALDAAARRSATRTLWFGLVALTVQTAVFFRLTFWDLSWDVMEPISYFVGMMFVIAGYFYFMLTSADFAYVDLSTRLTARAAAAGARAAKYDAARHEALAATARRCKAVLQLAAR